MRNATARTTVDERQGTLALVSAEEGGAAVANGHGPENEPDRKRPDASIEVRAQPFRLHPALDPAHYHMPGSCRNVRRWRARCHVANNGGEVGTMDEVGYVMISLSDDVVVPIARGDEHHRGHDLLIDMADGTWPGPGTKRSRRIDLDPADFVPVWSYGQNYVYDRSEIPDLLNLLGKWLAWGGADGVLEGANDLNGRAIRSSDFVARKGDMDVRPDELAPLGRDAYERLAALSRTLVALGRHPDRIAASAAHRSAAALLASLADYGPKVGIAHDELDAFRTRLGEARRDNDDQALWEAVFGIGGIKNALHMHVKTEGPKDSIWTADRLRAFWGDWRLANDMLGRL